MKLFIPKISLNQLSSKEIDVFNNLNSDVYGNELANNVAEKLTKSKQDGIYFSHRDYCGLGIFYHEEKFILSTVYDGYGMDTILAESDSKLEFISWLSHESDQSMSLYGDKFNNQTITKLRLHWFLEDTYSPVWNAFCQYLANTYTN